MINIELSTEEIELLRQHLDSSIRLIHFKATVILARHRKLSLTDICFLVPRSERTITRWINGFERRRMSSIFSGMVGNEHAAKLTKTQKLEIKQVIGQPPNDQGLPKEFWDVPKLKHYVSTYFGVVYESDVSYHFLLKFSGLSLKYPDKLSPRRNDTMITERIKEIKEEIEPYLKDPTWIVFTGDETMLQEEAEIRKSLVSQR